MDRKEHVEHVINPALNEGMIVILDRYFYSTAAYQSESADEVSPILCANEEFAPVPDRLIVLDVNPEHGIRRIIARGDLPNSFESEGQLTHAGEIFRSLDRLDYCRVIDGDRSLSKIHVEIVHIAKSAAMNKLAEDQGLTEEAVNDTLALFGGEPLANTHSETRVEGQ